MDTVKAANLVLRFLLELCVLAAVAFWGATTAVVALLARERVLLGVLLAVVYVVNKILMTVWDQ